jgi:hypothetical protein
MNDATGFKAILTDKSGTQTQQIVDWTTEDDARRQIEAWLSTGYGAQGVIIRPDGSRVATCRVNPLTHTLQWEK